MNKKTIYFLSVLLLIFQSYNYAQKVNYGGNPLETLDSLIKANKFGNVHSLVISKNGNLVFEKYYNGYTRDSLQKLYSVTKSITSLLFGVAAKQVKLPDPDTPIYKFFPEYRLIFDRSPIKKDIKLIHLFTMTAGFKWNEFGGYLPEVKAEKDWLYGILNLPLVNKPGKKFLYNTGLSLLLGAILRKIIKKPVDIFAKKNLFDKLGIKNYRWRKVPPRITDTGAGLMMRPVDLVKIGVLLLHKGGNIVDPGWLFLSTRKFIERGRHSDYCLQWWRYDSESDIAKIVSSNDIYFASGFGGQFLWIVPHLNLVVVLTAANFENPKVYHYVFKKFILGKFEKNN